MLFKSISFHSPVENILYDEVLLNLAEKNEGEETLRLWESPQTFLVLGRTSRIEEDVNLDAVMQDGIMILRRFSGGGTVVQGPGCLNFSLVLAKVRHPPLNDLRRSYAYILGRVLQVMERVGVTAAFHPISDLATVQGERKFSGNAQHRGRNFILHHGTILYQFDLTRVGRYLKMPHHVPGYRLGRSHADFLANIGASRIALHQAFCEVFKIERTEVELPEGERELLDSFVRVRAEAVMVDQPVSRCC